jgi:hypothetical protein
MHQEELNVIREDRRKFQVKSTTLIDQIRQLENVKTRRMDYLKMRYKDLPAAIEWVRHNQFKFKAEVFEPICLLVSYMMLRDRIMFLHRCY